MCLIECAGFYSHNTNSRLSFKGSNEKLSVTEPILMLSNLYNWVGHKKKKIAINPIRKIIQSILLYGQILSYEFLDEEKGFSTHLLTVFVGRLSIKDIEISIVVCNCSLDLTSQDDR